MFAHIINASTNRQTSKLETLKRLHVPFFRFDSFCFFSRDHFSAAVELKNGWDDEILVNNLQERENSEFPTKIWKGLTDVANVETFIWTSAINMTFTLNNVSIWAKRLRQIWFFSLLSIKIHLSESVFPMSMSKMESFQAEKRSTRFHYHAKA